MGEKFKNYILTENENKIRPYVIILINEVSIDLLNHLNSILKDNDIISFLITIHGGNI